MNLITMTVEAQLIPHRKDEISSVGSGSCAESVCKTESTMCKGKDISQVTMAIGKQLATD